MALRRAPLALLLLALAGLSWLQPLAAFDFASTGTRAVAADVVADGSAYLGLSGGTCNIPTGGGSCAITLANRGTAAQTYSVTKSADADNRVLSYQITGGSLVTSGATTSSEVAVGGSATLTATIKECVSCLGNTYYIYWDTTAANAGVLDAERARYRMSVTYVAA